MGTSPLCGSPKVRMAGRHSHPFLPPGGEVLGYVPSLQYAELCVTPTILILSTPPMHAYYASSFVLVRCTVKQLLPTSSKKPNHCFPVLNCASFKDAEQVRL